MNINEYVAETVIKHLNDRNDYIAILERDLKTSVKAGVMSDWKVCHDCDKIIRPWHYKVGCRCQPLTVQKVLCYKCGLKVDRYHYTDLWGEKTNHHFFNCDDCINSDHPMYTDEANKVT